MCCCIDCGDVVGSLAATLEEGIGVHLYKLAAGPPVLQEEAQHLRPYADEQHGVACGGEYRRSDVVVRVQSLQKLLPI